MSDKFYLTTTLPYVNSDPHLGFALEIVQADVIVRYQKLLGREVFFNTGTDEHGQKIYQKAIERGIAPQEYCDEYAAKFRQLVPALGILSDIHFIRTTDEKHVRACQEFWRLCEKNGDIYKQKYKVKYCVGCELEKTDSELENGRCPIHPNLELELRDEENYFFRFSKYADKLLEMYRNKPDFVVPDFRFNEIREFVKKGLQDFSISRLKDKMPWGVPVPGDDAQVMYVWFDALINYVSTLGWPGSDKSENQRIRGSDHSDISTSDSRFSDFWPGVQIAGKDNLRQQSAMWQAMLMSAGLPNSKQIIIHGFITSGGQKMSKSLGNVANPYEILSKLQEKGLSQEQATDALRYYLLREIPTFEDGDYTWEHFVETYNAGLANGVGNLTSRILKMAINAGIQHPESRIKNKESGFLEKYELARAIDEVWKKIQACDQYIQKEEPFKKIKVDAEAAKKDILHLLEELSGIALSLKPFLPVTAGRILTALNDVSAENIPKLFPRI